MDPVRQQRQMILPIVVLVLGVVLIWWMWIWPRTPQFKTYKRKAAVKADLQNIEPPRGVHLVSVHIIDLSEINQLSVTALYSGDIGCDAVIAHYKKEFPKQGFALTNEEEDIQKHIKTLSFSAPKYGGYLTCLRRRDLPQEYLIVLLTKA